MLCVTCNSLAIYGELSSDISQPVPEADHLPVRHILVVLRPELNLVDHASQIPHSTGTTTTTGGLGDVDSADGTRDARVALEPFLGRAALVRGVQVEPQAQGQADDDGVAQHDGEEGRVVGRGVVGAEQVRARNVASAVGDEEHGRHRHLLGDAPVVGLDERHGQRHGGRARGEQKVPHHVRRAGGAGARVDDRCAGDAGQHDGDDEEAVCTAVAAGQPTSAGDPRRGEQRVGDVDERGLQRREAKGADDEVGKVLRAAVGHLRRQLHAEEEPRLGVRQALGELVPAPDRLVRAARAGHHHAVPREFALLLGEEPRARDAVGQKVKDGRRPEESRTAQDYVHPPPGADVVVNVADAKGYQGGKHPAYRVAREPDPGPEGYLVARVPRRGEEHEGGRNGRLGDPEEEADGQETTIVAACRRHGHRRAPEQGISRHVLGHREASDEQGRRPRPHEVAKVED